MAWERLYPWMYLLLSIVLLIFAMVLWSFAVQIRRLNGRLVKRRSLLSGARVSDYGPHDEQEISPDVLNRLEKLERKVDRLLKLLGEAHAELSRLH
jgi:hypothetical protein